jgi:hypothetical protein
LAHQGGLDLVAIAHRHRRGQHVDGVADHPQMILTDRAGSQRGGHPRQFRWQRRAADLAARRHRGLVGRVGDLAEHPIRQGAVGALLRLQPLGELRPKRIAHLITGQLPHLGIGGIHLSGQLAQPRTSRPSSDENAYTATLSNAGVSQPRPAASLCTRSGLGITAAPK